MRVESCLDSWETVGNRVYRSAIGYFRGHGQSTWLFPSVGTPQRSAQLIPFADSINRLIFHGCHGCSPRVGPNSRFLSSRILRGDRRGFLFSFSIIASSLSSTIIIFHKCYDIMVCGAKSFQDIPISCESDRQPITMEWVLAK